MLYARVLSLALLHVPQQHHHVDDGFDQTPGVAHGAASGLEVGNGGAQAPQGGGLGQELVAAVLVDPADGVHQGIAEGAGAQRNLLELHLFGHLLGAHGGVVAVENAREPELTDVVDQGISAEEQHEEQGGVNLGHLGGAVDALPVVLLTQVIVVQNLVGLADFLELALRLLVVGVLVGMILERELVVRLLDRGLGGVAFDAQALVHGPVGHFGARRVLIAGLLGGPAGLVAGELEVLHQTVDLVGLLGKRVLGFRFTPLEHLADLLRFVHDQVDKRAAEPGGEDTVVVVVRLLSHLTSPARGIRLPDVLDIFQRDLDVLGFGLMLGVDGVAAGNSHTTACHSAVFRVTRVHDHERCRHNCDEKQKSRLFGFARHHWIRYADDDKT
ncbi:peptidyl-prolyl cis-trans isomerase [Babesia caballi]|uniref:Peptidyl-prolyl cis-trans isomerase n=1 Tax=Babesia caballi TaxID=5871 RepID=A0AAV4LTX3_BABCB|nr:peptidyl-prolyl cis-trans isomerase [Babesia caballi]